MWELWFQNRINILNTANVKTIQTTKLEDEGIKSSKANQFLLQSKNKLCNLKN